MKKTECLFCKKKNIIKKNFIFKTIYNKKLFFQNKCSNCKISYIAPTPTSDDINKIYSYKSYYKKYYLIENSINNNFSYFFQYVQKYLKLDNRILDYGCGDGNLIRFFENKGFNIFGADFESEMIQILKNNKIKVFDFQELERKISSFDVVLMRDVFEHSTNPINLINSICSILDKHGILIIDGPLEKNLSLTNIAIKINTLIKYYFLKIIIEQPPYHLTFFSNMQLINFVESTNKFSVVKYKLYETGWPLKGNGVVKNLIAYISIFLSKLLFFSNFYGNRSIVIFKKK